MASEPSWAAVLVVLFHAASLLGCGDPVKDLAVDALGPEAPGVPEGPLHRPGQPCLVCHDGGEARAFAMAGTVYLAPDSDLPAPGASVHMADAWGGSAVALANCAGNFFVKPED